MLGIKLKFDSYIAKKKELRDGCVIYLIGNCFYKDKAILTFSELTLDFLDRHRSHFTGNYTLIILSSSSVRIDSDIIRSYRVFLTIDHSNVIISDALTAAAVKNKESLLRFLRSGMTFNNGSLIEGVYQNEANEVLELCLKTNLVRSRRAQLFRNDGIKRDLDGLAETLVDLIKKRRDYFEQYETIFLPLSGGVDSRLLLYGFIKAGVKNLTCYTYGARFSREVYVAELLQKKLGFKWLHIDYDDKTWSRFGLKNNSKYRERYIKLFSYTSLPIVQEYPAIDYLSKKYDLSECIFIPGHAADFLAGSHRSRYLAQIEEKTAEEIVELAFFGNFKRNVPMLSLNELGYVWDDGKDITQILTDIENFNYSSRQVKLIANSANIFDVFGSSRYMPFWDREVVSLFQDLAPELRNDRKYYDDYVKSLFALEYGLRIPFSSEINHFHSISMLINGLSKLKVKIQFWRNRHLNLDLGFHTRFKNTRSSTNVKLSVQELALRELFENLGWDLDNV